MQKHVLVISLDLDLVDFSAFPGMDPEKVLAVIGDEVVKMAAFGYAVQTVFLDLGETAETVLRERLESERFACVVMGASVRKHLLLFEKALNLVHTHAPHASIAFNTQPHDTIDAIRRWT